MYRAEDAEWLARKREALIHGDFLEEALDFERLARGFVACNIIIDLTRFFADVVQRPAGKDFIAQFPFTLFADWLDTLPAAPSPDPAGLVGPGGAAAVHALHDRWRCQALWIAVESVLARLPNNGHSAKANAKQRFAPPGTHPFPEDCARCCRRDPHDDAAHEKWWDLWLSALLQMLQAHWHALSVQQFAPAHQVRLELSQRLVHFLSAAGPWQALLAWVIRKHKQMMECVRQINRNTSGPKGVPNEWFRRMSGRIRDAVESTPQRMVLIAAQDHQFLKSTVESVRTQGFATIHRLTLNYIDSILGLKSMPVAVPPHDLPYLAREWEGLMAAKHMRRLPPEWGSLHPVADVFGLPDPRHFLFDTWVRTARHYGM